MNVGIIQIFLIENYPWVIYASLNDRDWARFGEWAWVGRVYE
jgi:hypothetical protein